MSTRSLLPSVVLPFAVVIAVHAVASAGPQAFPDGAARPILETKCADCHAPDLVQSFRKSSDDWLKLVRHMNGLGAMLTDEEIPTVADYLAKNWPNTDPPPPPFIFPSGEGKEILETECSSCHTPELVRAYGKDSDEWGAVIGRMNSEGAKVTGDQQPVLAEYLATNWPPRKKQ